MSLLAYEKADIVTCLYARARLLQMDLGCPEEKIRITPNGINVNGFLEIPGKTEEDQDAINVGAVLRVTPIKDVKTMIQALNNMPVSDNRINGSSGISVLMANSLMFQRTPQPVSVISDK